MRTKNYFSDAKLLSEEWENAVINRTAGSIAYWNKEKKLPEGNRFPFGAGVHLLDIASKVLLAPKTQKYLEETPLNTGTIGVYGDYEIIISELKAQEQKFSKINFENFEKINPQDGGKIMISSCEVYFSKGKYYLVSCSSYYTGYTGARKPYVILFETVKPFKIITTEKGDLENYSYGYIQYI